MHRVHTSKNCCRCFYEWVKTCAKHVMNQPPLMCSCRRKMRLPFIKRMFQLHRLQSASLHTFSSRPVISWILNSRKAESNFGTRYASNEEASLSYRPRRSVKFEVGTKTITDTSIDAIPGQNINAHSVSSHDNVIFLPCQFHKTFIVKFKVPTSCYSWNSNRSTA